MKAVFLIFVHLYLFPSSLNISEELPELNQKIIEYVQSVLGTQVDRGECWDLAYQALKRSDADWDNAFIYGDLINPYRDKVYPGDIIQFKNVIIKYTKGNAIYTETMIQHTAIVYEVLDEGIYKIAHQNNTSSGKKVGIDHLNISNIVKGKASFYRPTLKRKQLPNDE